MKRFFRYLLALSLITPAISLAISPAHAVEYRPPTWAEGTGAPEGFSWGNWLPCRSDYQTTDCIDSVTWLKSDGGKVAGDWVPESTFSFEEFSQTWNVTSNGESAQSFKESIRSIGSYTFQGLITPCQDSRIVVDIRPARYGFQVNAGPTCDSFFRSKFEERFEITIKSKNLRGYVGGMSSNGKNPEISFATVGDEQFLSVKLNFAYIAWNRSEVPGEVINVCEKNQFKASEAGWGLWSSIFWTKMLRDPFLAENPGDMIAGTNGWNCGGNIRWDPQEVALVMEVGAPHFDLDGSLNQGWYEGAIRGRYISARFGIKPELAAGSARLEISYDTGEVKVATITAKYDKATDWLYLNGYGFTYSTPKLLIKFQQPAVAPNKVTPQKKQTIICTKGKVTKKITGTKPLCPKGFKQKT